MERLAYGLLALVPLLVRLINLGERALAPAEAHTALRAWQQAQALHPALDAGQPLLFTLQSLTFFVAGANDALARAWPVLAAAAIPLALYHTRSWLGRGPALIAAMLITFSPLVNAFARRGDGVSFALLAAAIVLAGWAQVQQARPLGWSWIMAGGAVALLSGPAGFTTIIALGLILALTYPTSAERFGPSARDWGIFAVILFLGGTLFLLRVDALGLMALNLTQWLHDFSSHPKMWLLGLVRMAADEPLLSLFGFIAVVWGVRQKGKTRALSIAAALVTLIAIAQGPDVAYSRAVAAFFLALPTAVWFARLARGRAFSLDTLEEVLFVIVIILLAFLSAYALISFAHSGSFDQLLLFLATIFMGIVMTGVFILFLGWREVSRSLLVGWLILTILFGAGMTWQLAFNPTLPTLARLYPTETMPDARDLVQTYGDISQRLTGDRWAEEIVLIPGSETDDLVKWYLRQSAQFQVVDGLNMRALPPIIIAPPEMELSLGDDYAGQTFVLTSNWGIDHLASSNDAIRWFFFRRTPFPPPATDTINLWVDMDLLSLEEKE